MSKSETTTATYTGTPLEIGSQVFINLCMPVINAASQTQCVDGDQIAHMYAGFLQACMGSLAADFGHEQAVQLVEMMAAAFKAADLSEPPVQTH